MKLGILTFMGLFCRGRACPCPTVISGTDFSLWPTRNPQTEVCATYAGRDEPCPYKDAVINFGQTSAVDKSLL